MARSTGARSCGHGAVADEARRCGRRSRRSCPSRPSGRCQPRPARSSASSMRDAAKAGEHQGQASARPPRGCWCPACCRPRCREHGQPRGRSCSRRRRSSGSGAARGAPAISAAVTGSSTCQMTSASGRASAKRSVVPGCRDPDLDPACGELPQTARQGRARLILKHDMAHPDPRAPYASCPAAAYRPSGERASRRAERHPGRAAPGGPARVRRAAHGRAADRRRVLGHLAGRPAARGPVCVKRALAQAAGRGRLARAGRAQRLRGALDADGAAASCPARRRELLGEDRAGRRAGDGATSTPARLPAVEERAARRRGRRRRSPRAVGERAGARSMPRTAGRADDRGRSSRPTRSSTTSGSSPTCSRPARAPSGPGAARCARWSRRTAHDQASRWCMATSARRTSWSAPDGPVFLDAECAWYGDPAFDLAFCLNHLLLKCLWTPAGARRASSPASTRWREPISAASTGSRAAALEARAARAAARAVPGAGRRQVAGRVRHRRGRQGAGAPRRRRVPAGAGPRPLAADRARPGRVELGAMSATRRSRAVHAAAGSGTAAAGRRSRPRSQLAGGARRPRHRAGRRLDRHAARRSTCATAASAFGGSTCTRAVASVERRDRAGAASASMPRDQAALDARLIELDGTPDKSRLGGNATVAVSMAAAHAAAAARRRAAVALSRRRRRRRCCRCRRSRSSAAARTPAGRVDIQDFMVVCPGARELRPGAGVDRRGLPRRRRADGRSAARCKGVADEGGWWPDFATNEEALETLVRAIERAGFAPGEQVAIALDIAASRVRPRRPLPARPRDGASSTASGMIELLLGWLDALSDRLDRGPAGRGRSAGLRRASPARCGGRVQVVGDDFLVTDAGAGARGRRARRRQRGAAQAQPARHADRDARRPGTRRRRCGMARHRLGALRRDRGRDHRPSRGRLGRRPAQGRLVRPLASAWRSGTRRCASRRRWAGGRGLPGGARSRSGPLGRRAVPLGPDPPLAQSRPRVQSPSSLA